MKILTNKKYKKFIKDREWALKNYAYAEKEIKKQNKDIETLLFENSNLRIIKHRLAKKVAELNDIISELEKFLLDINMSTAYEELYKIGIKDSYDKLQELKSKGE